MADELPGEMPSTPTEMEGTTPAAPTSAEMVQISAEELKTIRDSLKKANAEAAKYRKSAEQIETERRAKEQAEMTELQKAQARAAELEAQIKGFERSKLQAEAAAKVGLPAALASRLVGETPEELETDAKAILETLPKSPKPTPGLTPMNPGANGSPGETLEQKRDRLLGRNPDPFAGGKVIFTLKE